MSYKEWLYAELENEGFIDPAEIDIEEMDTDLLLSCTDLEEADLDNYAQQFEEHCANRGEAPIWDLY